MKHLFLTFLLTTSIVFPQKKWQQRADYSMDIPMDVSDFTYNGTQKVIYTNYTARMLQKDYLIQYKELI